ncbi:D-dopachrome decarboxylase isoform X2 [Maylandia zebra]
MFTSGFASSYDTSVSASHGHVRASSSNMPFIELQSNLPAGQFSEAFLKRLCSSTAAALGKPEDRMNVVVTPGLPMLMAGSTSPCVILSVSAIGVTDTAEKNKEHSAKIFEFLTKELDLSQDR